MANRLASKVLVAVSPSPSVSVALNVSWISLARFSVSWMNSITGTLIVPRPIVS
ncbi:hypothetical protein D3C75_1270790 [compost metagenome]